VSLAARLEAKTERITETGCWLWMGNTTRFGYGMIHRGGGKHIVLAHRASYEVHKGPIPEGKQLDHLCRVRCCINPAHLEPVTNRENARRGLTGKINHRNARKTACPKGHPLTPENVYFNARANGRVSRRCKICTLANNRASARRVTFH
jgi:hypothetical protein